MTTMQIDRAVVEQALEALDKLYLPGELERVNAAITALRAALVAAAEREACAALLEANGMRCGEESLSRLILETNASAIRARNNT